MHCWPSCAEHQNGQVSSRYGGKLLPQGLTPLPRSPVLPACMLREGPPVCSRRAAEGSVGEEGARKNLSPSVERAPAGLLAPCQQCHASEMTLRSPDATMSGSHLHRGTAGQHIKTPLQTMVHRDGITVGICDDAEKLRIC